MKISLNWLSDFVTWIETDPHAIADRLTLGTAEVEEVEEQGKFLKHCCVGEILTLEKHPNADKLSVCTVKTDKGTKTVVCGGTNLSQGMLIAFAHVGATVKHGTETVTLTKVKIRGIESEGMICAAEELDLMDLCPHEKGDGERPVINLSRFTQLATSQQANKQQSTFEAGTPLKELFNLTDTILHINNTAITMRPDLFSHVGFARECVAIGLAKWKKEPVWKMPKFPSTKGKVHMKSDCPELTPRYLGCEIAIDGLGETPDWMKKKLEAVGWRCVNLPVDITNYITSEIGVPLHSFDADDIRGTVHVRLSKKDEVIRTLDDVERKLPDGALILNDDEGIFDLLGIMGGLRSSTKESTKHIYLHAASLDPASIRRAILGTNHRTDAATIYEKGVPPITTEQGFIRALELFLELLPNAKLVSSLESYGDNGKAPTIELTTEQICMSLGIDIPEKIIVKILEDLGFKVKKAGSRKPEASVLSVTAPLHRLRDIRGSHDIIEEVGRIYGYDKLEGVMPTAELRIPERDNRLHTMRDTLKSQNYFEIVPLSFVSEHVMKKVMMPVTHAIEIENPLGEETALLQTSTLPHLLVHAEKNIRLVEETLKTFHWSHVFTKGKPERVEFSSLIASRTDTDLLHDPFLEAKENIMLAAKHAGYEIDVKEMKDIPAYAHPGRTAELTYEGKVIGTVFEIHPTIRATFDLPARAAAATLDISTLFALSAKHASAKPLPLFPAVSYDITIPRTHSSHVADLLAKAKSESTLLESIVIHDLYQKKNEDAYQLTLRLTYRSQERTLTEDEVKKEHEKVLHMMGA